MRVNFPVLGRWAGVLLALLLLYAAGEGYREMRAYNDFEVLHWGAGQALEWSPNLYDATSPIKDRRFVYPPSGAILLAPVAMLPFPAACVVFLVVKNAALVALFWATIRAFAGCGLPRGAKACLALAAVLLVFRPLSNDMNLGQVNPIVVALAVCGVILMMACVRYWWIGAVLLALSVALKLTTILLLAVPFLHRKWRGFFLALALSVVLLAVLPRVWFEHDLARYLEARFDVLNGKMFLDAVQTDEQSSFYEFLVFTYSMATLDQQGLEYDADSRRLYHYPGGSKKRFFAPDPFTPATARLIWLTIGVLSGAGFLLWRSYRFAGKSCNWTWDLAVLCVLVILLSPLVRKAHLVILTVPVIWILMRILGRQLRGQPLWPGSSLKAFSAAAAILLFVMDDPVIPVPGLLAMPYHPGILGCCLALLGVLHLEAGLLGQDAGDSPRALVAGVKTEAGEAGAPPAR